MRSGRPPEHGGAAADGSSPSVLPTRPAPRLRGTRPRAPRQPGPLHPSRHGFPARLRRLRNAAWPFRRESPPKGAASRMGLRAPCPAQGARPLGNPIRVLRAGRARSAQAPRGCRARRPRLRRPHDIPAKPGKGPAETGFGGDGGFRLREAGSAGAAARGSASKRMQAGLASRQGRNERKEGSDAA